MAQFGGTFEDWPETDWDAEDFDWDENWKQQQKRLGELTDAAKNTPKGSLVGVLVQTGVADGTAIYIVTKESPLTLKHIPYSDGYQMNGYMMKGITKKDLLQERERKEAHEDQEGWFAWTGIITV